MNKIQFTTGNKIAFSNANKILFGCEERCEHCNLGTTPRQLAVTFSGIVDKGFCVACVDLNGGKLADQSVVSCVYRYDLSPAKCPDGPYTHAYTSLFAELTASQLIVFWSKSDYYGIRQMEWRKNVATPVDCNFDTDVPYYGGADPFYCDGSASTCHVEAVY